MTNYLTLKDLKDIVKECEDYADETPVLLCTGYTEKAKFIFADDLYTHRTLCNYRFVPSEMIEQGMPTHEKNGAIELILDGLE